jgi:imidazolonepropionase-like amidohydrolase
MNATKTLKHCLLVLAAFAPAAYASDTIPAPPQDRPILLTGGDVYTVSGEVIRGGEVLFDKGKLVAVGRDVPAPSDVKRIDVSGKRVYPSLFAVGNDLGLTEVGSVRGTLDQEEVGSVNPNARAEVAVNPDSELIPVARANGVLLNLTAPEGSGLPGASAVMQLDGWTWEDLTLKAPAAVHLTWPRSGPTRVRRFTTLNDPAEQTRQRDEATRAFDKAFDDARAYLAAKKAAAGESSASGNSRKVDFDARWEAMAPLLEGKIPLIVTADEVRQIEAAVVFAARQKVKLIVFGGYDAPLCADLLKQHGVAVIVNGVHRLPIRQDGAYDEPFTLPERLRQAGIPFCITGGSRHGARDVRNLPYHAATAAAYGLPADEALKAVTLYPARLLGVADRVGSLEPGKDATLIVTDGDALETPTRVELAFVQGRQIDLSSKHTRLWDKYRQRYERQKGTPANAKAE